VASERYEPDQTIAMLRRSYGAVDGLWFVMCEERLGRDAALELDDAVWKVMPKIQARKARELLGLTANTRDDLAQAIGLKFAAEGQEFEVSQTGERLEVRVTQCPWHDALAKSNRLHIAAQVARIICTNEAEGWAQEFGHEAAFDFESSKCGGGECCRFAFHQK
jgi:hypothetical protein